MATEIRESLGFEAKPTRNKWRVKVIESGWGSSGYYGSDVLAKFGPTTFTAGTKVYMNHPTSREDSERPERDVHQLAGKLVSDAVFQENALFADIEFYSHYAPIIREMAGDVGLSIRALGEARIGEAEGKSGPIIESLVADPFTSVDVVTVAGAGGKFITLLESYTQKDSLTIPVEESELEGDGMTITKEDLDAAIADIKATFAEALSPVIESVSTLVESAQTTETADAVEAEATDEVVEAEPEIDAVEVAEKFVESGLPKVALARVAESLKSEANTKSVDELIADEKAYADSLREAVVASVEDAPLVGHVQESKTESLADQFNAITSRISGNK